MSKDRVPVVLRFKNKDIQIIKAILAKEIGPGVPISKGLKGIIINIMNAYLKEVTNDGKANPTGDTEKADGQLQDSDSPVLAD